MKKRWFNLGNILGTMLILAVIVGFALYIYSHNHPKEYFPSEGVWYCEELQIQLSFNEPTGTFPFEEPYDCYFMVDGIKTASQWRVDKGSNIIAVTCQDLDCKDCELGESVFTGVFVSSDQNTLCLREYEGTAEYTFERIG